MSDADDIKDAAVEAAQGPLSATTDGVSATAHDPEKLLNVADRIASRTAAVGTSRGILFTKLKPPGAV